MTYRVFTLSDALAPKPKRLYLVDKIIQERSFTAFYGYPGSLKSSIVLDMAMAVATGKHFLPSMPGSGGTFPGYKTFQVPVFWIDIDNGEDVTAERIAAFAKTYKADPATPFYWMSYPEPALKASNQNSVNSIASFILNSPYKPGWIIIDTLLRAAGVKDENSSEMDAVMSNLHKFAEDLKAAMTVISHSRKENAGRAGNGLRGHSSIEGGLDSVFYVDREENKDLIQVNNQKARRKPVDPFSARWTYIDDPVSDELLEARFYFEPTNRMTKQQIAQANLCQTIIDTLKSNGITNKAALFNLVGGNRNNFNDALQKNIDDGFITKKTGAKNAVLFEAL